METLGAQAWLPDGRHGALGAAKGHEMGPNITAAPSNAPIDALLHASGLDCNA